MCFHEIRVIFFFTSQHKDVFFPGSREAVSGRRRAGRLQKVEYWALICCCVTLAKNSPGQGPSVLIYKMRFFDGEQSFSRDFPGSSAGKESTCNAGDLSSIAGSRSSPGEGISSPLQYSWASLPAIQETWVGKIPWRRAWQPTPVFLPGESPWTEEPGRLQSMGSQRVGYNWVTKYRAEFSNVHVHMNPLCVLWFSTSLVGSLHFSGFLW